MVGAAGFELATPCTPCKCATRLRYAPKREIIAEHCRRIMQFLSSCFGMKRTLSKTEERRRAVRAHCAWRRHASYCRRRTRLGVQDAFLLPAVRQVSQERHRNM